MGVLKIRGRWGIEWYGEDGKRKRKVISRLGERQESVSLRQGTISRRNPGPGPRDRLFPSRTRGRGLISVGGDTPSMVPTRVGCRVCRLIL